MADNTVVFVVESGPSRKGEAVANYGPAINDTGDAWKLYRELGLGKYYTKTIGKKSYIIFKGSPSIRQSIKGTKYTGGNAKIVDMVIGKKGMAASAIKGAKITFVLYTAVNVLNYIFDDSFTLSQLIGYTITDLTKTVIAGAVGYLLAGAMAASTVGVVAVGPVLVGIGISIGLGALLDILDDKLGVTKAVIEAVQRAQSATVESYDSVMRRVAAYYGQFEKEFVYWVTNGQMTLGAWP